jgi:hypothetical protein
MLFDVVTNEQQRCSHEARRAFLSLQGPSGIGIHDNEPATRLKHQVSVKLLLARVIQGSNNSRYKISDNRDGGLDSKKFSCCVYSDGLTGVIN